MLAQVRRLYCSFDQVIYVVIYIFLVINNINQKPKIVTTSNIQQQRDVTIFLDLNNIYQHFHEFFEICYTPKTFKRKIKQFLYAYTYILQIFVNEKYYTIILHVQNIISFYFKFIYHFFTHQKCIIHYQKQWQQNIKFLFQYRSKALSGTKLPPRNFPAGGGGLVPGRAFARH